MGLTAREWLLLPAEEQDALANELLPEECRKLRMDLSMIHYTEEQKDQMTEEEKYKFTNPKEYTQTEIELFSNEAAEIFKRMQAELK